MQLTDEPVTVGVVGGGQLCRMMCEAGAPLGLEVVFVDPTPRAPASPVGRDQIVGGFDDEEALAELADRSDVITYDIELADPAAIEAADPDVPVHPDPGTLRLIQDKLRQKDALTDEGIPAPDYRDVDGRGDLLEAGDELGWPLMLKARRGGYDGRGNKLVRSADEAGEALGELPGPLVAEAFVDYDRELSVVLAQGRDGTAAFPTTETIHEEQILRRTVAPARTDAATLDRARDVATRVLDVMDGRGVYAVELFEREGDVLVNEVAPRPHNSGHWTIEGAVTSQFEQHLRAVAGLPLGSPDLREPAVTVNILGDEGDRPVRLAGVEPLLETPRAHLHWYGKREERRLRKMGHFTCVGGDVDALIETADRIQKELRFEP
jgi:5-(carboxyamino)imidazole ribonucleotide synthase